MKMMVKISLPNLAPPGLGSQKMSRKLVHSGRTSSPHAHRKTSSLVTSRSAMREATKVEVFFSLCEVTKAEVFLSVRGDEVRPRGDESSSFPRGDQSCALIFETFWALLDAFFLSQTKAGHLMFRYSGTFNVPL